jgi:hypothetical protein
MGYVCHQEGRDRKQMQAAAVQRNLPDHIFVVRGRTLGAQKALRAVMGEREKHLVQKIMSGWVYAGARVQSGAGHVPTRRQNKVERVEGKTAFRENAAICHDKSDEWVQLSNSAPIFV